MQELTYQVQSCRTRAAHSLPSCLAQAAGVHLAHIAHADDTDALAVVHCDCVYTHCGACVERGVQPMLKGSLSCDARRVDFSTR